MSDYLTSLLKSGRTLLVDTKAPRKTAPGKKGAQGPATKDLAALAETDPYKIFIRKATSEKMKKADMVKEIERFITAAEADL